MHYTLFPTALGQVAIAWTERGIAQVQLPEAREADTVVRLEEHVQRRTQRRTVPGAELVRAEPPAFVRAAIDCVTRHLGGEPVTTKEWAVLRLDFDGVPPFHRKVYELARRIGAGETLSYGELARRAGSPGAARAVGQAMAKNPVPLLVPCHRVLGSGGALHGFSAPGGVATKAQLLRAEGALSDERPKEATRRVKAKQKEPAKPSPKPARSVRAPSKKPASPAPALPLFVESAPPRVVSWAAAAVRHLAQTDRPLGRLIERVGGDALARRFQPRGDGDPFLSLAQSIVYQQLSGRAAATIYGRVCALFQGGQPAPAALLALSDETLRAAGLSGAKLAALRDLAEHAVSGKLPTSDELACLDEDAIVERLVAVRGVGRWTAEMLLLFGLGRPDVLPASDLGVRKGYALTYGLSELPSPRALLEHGERWRPYRSAASWYFWRALE